VIRAVKRMMTSLKKSEDIVAQLAAAFHHVPQPTPDELVPHNGLDEKYVIEHFSGKRREDLLEIPEHFGDDLSYMTPSAIHYYLPSFLTYLIRKRDEFHLFITVVGFLDRTKSQECGVVWPDMSNVQKTSILGWLDFMIQHIGSYDLGQYEPEYTEIIHKAIKQWQNA